MSKNNSSENNQNWFCETYDSANDAYLGDQTNNIGEDVNKKLPIASPIFDVSGGGNKAYKEINNKESRQSFALKFPYQQIIRGDGACFFNASIAGISNKCVGEAGKEKWQVFRRNLIANNCQEIANQIGGENETLTREEVNKLLQARGDGNIVRRLSQKLIVPKTQEFKGIWEKKLADEILALSNANISNESQDKIDQINLNIERCEKNISNYSITADDGLCNIYDETDTSPIVESLTKNDNSKIAQIFSIKKDDVNNNFDEIFSVHETIYLWNQDGDSHFNLIYHNSDPVCQEIEALRNPQTEIRENQRQNRISNNTNNFSRNQNSSSNNNSRINQPAATTNFLNNNNQRTSNQNNQINNNQRTSNQNQSPNNHYLNLNASNQNNQTTSNPGQNNLSSEIIPHTSPFILNEITPAIKIENNIWKQTNRGNKFNFAVTDYSKLNQNLDLDQENQEAEDIFLNILQKITHEFGNASNSNKTLSQKQVLKIIEYAKQKGGVHNKLSDSKKNYQINDDLSASDLAEAGLDLKMAKTFSARFQKECEKCGIYSGRETRERRVKKMDGLRLTFIPDDVVEKLKSNENIISSDFYEEIKSKINKRTEKVSKLLENNSTIVRSR